MNLYDCMRNSWVIPITTTQAPPEARVIDKGELIKFYHIDGMYSYCKDTQGNVVHLPAWQEVRYATDEELRVLKT